MHVREEGGGEKGDKGTGGVEGVGGVSQPQFFVCQNFNPTIHITGRIEII